MKIIITVLAMASLSLALALINAVNVYGQINQTQQFDEEQYRKKLQKDAEKYFKNWFESGIFNETGIPFDLNKSYTNEEISLIAMKLLIHMCHNRPDLVNHSAECDLRIRQYFAK